MPIYLPVCWDMGWGQPLWAYPDPPVWRCGYPCYRFGNIGATNVLRTGRKELALATLLLDGGKGGITVLMTNSLIQPEIGAIAGFAAVVGHCFRYGCALGAARGGHRYCYTYAIDLITGLFMIGCWLIVAFYFGYPLWPLFSAFAGQWAMAILCRFKRYAAMGDRRDICFVYSAPP